MGAATAHQAMVTGIARRVVIVDDAADRARGLALDIRQAAPLVGATGVVDGTDDLAAVVGATVVVVADRQGPAGEWRDDAGLAVVARVRALNPTALVVCAGATQSPLIERFVKERDGDRTRLVGSAPEALRQAVTAVVCLETGTAPADVALAAIGRPPQAMFVPWDGASIAGSRATEVLSAAVLARLDRQLPFLWPPGPLTLATAAVRVASLRLAEVGGWVAVSLVPEATADTQPGVVAIPARAVEGGLRAEWPMLAPRDRVRLESLLAV